MMEWLLRAALGLRAMEVAGISREHPVGDNYGAVYPGAPAECSGR
jgi:hypothetical protein